MEPELKIPSQKGQRAFSLIELLVVTAILLLLLGAAVTSLNSVSSNAVLNRAGQSVADELILARQEAITKNRDVEVRFFHRGSPAGPQAVQYWILTEDGSAQVPLGRVLTLPESVRWNTNHSPLVKADATVSGTISGPPNAQPYTGFRFRPDGSVAQSAGTTNNYLTLQLLSEKRDPPANFYALQVNTVNGKLTTHRP